MGINTKVRHPAIFLDRDGTIIHQVELLSRTDQIRLIPGAAEAIQLFNKLRFLVIVVTNQPVVARGIVTENEVVHIHDVLVKRLSKKDARIDAFYFCPHHANANLKKYRVVCTCRKPEPGMILEAAKEHSIDLKKSFLIGDSTQDVLAGNRAKVKMILVKTGHGGGDSWQHNGKPDFIAKNILTAATIIKRETKK